MNYGRLIGEYTYDAWDNVTTKIYDDISIAYLDHKSINGMNLYAYCGNDPINRFDQTGHS